MSGTTQPHADDGPTRSPSTRRRRGWWACLHWTIALGMACAVFSWGWSGPAAGTLSVGTFAALAAASVWGGTGPESGRRIIRCGVLAGLTTTAAVGLVSALDLIGAFLVLVLVATSPAVTDFARARRLPGGPLPAGVPSDSSLGAAPAEEHLAPALPHDLGLLDDAALCQAWRRSFTLLGTAGSVQEHLDIVEQRRCYLDELARRSPRGMATWLASGARAPGNPFPYLGNRNPPSPPGG